MNWLNVWVGKIKKHGRFKIKNILVFTFIIVVGILTSAIITLSSNFFREVMTNNLIESAQGNLLKSIEMLEIKLQNIYQISYGISNNQRLKDILTEQNDSLDMQVQDQNEVRTILLSYCRLVDYIYSVNVFKNDFNKASNKFQFGSLEDTIGFGVSDYKLFEDYFTDKKNVFYTYKEGMYFNKFYNSFLDIPTISSVRPISERYQGQIGIVNINARADYLFRHISNLSDKYNSRIYIIDKDGNTLFYNHPKGVQDELDTSLFSKEIIRKKSGWMNFNHDGKDYIIVFNSVGSTGWMVTDIIPYNEIMSDFNKVRTKIITFSIMVSLLVIALYLLISSSIVRPLNAVAESFRRMQKGDLSVTAERSMLVEVDELSEDFNKMVETLNNLLEEIKVANKKERDAELKALQVQINPHFLYNTLDIIYWMTDSKEIASITNNLARFFRLSLSSGKNIISVEEELEQVRVYLNIQNIRFKNKFVYIEKIDPEVLEYPMLKLILQPLVENALLHGLKYVKDGGIITVHCKIHNGNLEFKVEDNGTGVDLERINYILEGHEVHKGYGIKNVNERIKLQYGSAYGLYYSNLEKGGTCVTMIIPAINSSDRNEKV